MAFFWYVARWQCFVDFSKLRPPVSTQGFFSPFSVSLKGQVVDVLVFVISVGSCSVRFDSISIIALVTTPRRLFGTRVILVSCFSSFQLLDLNVEHCVLALVLFSVAASVSVALSRNASRALLFVCVHVESGLGTWLFILRNSVLFCLVSGREGTLFPPSTCG